MCVVAIIRYFILFSREGEGEEVVQFLPYIFYFLFFRNKTLCRSLFFNIYVNIHVSPFYHSPSSISVL